MFLISFPYSIMLTLFTNFISIDYINQTLVVFFYQQEKENLVFWFSFIQLLYYKCFHVLNISMLTLGLVHIT